MGKIDPNDTRWPLDEKLKKTNGSDPEGLHAQEEPAPSLPQWPEDLGEDAMYGVTGALVRVVEPHTESDPAALTIQFLVGFGSLIGRGPYVRVEADHHCTNEFAVLVGTTARARKGTSWGRIRAFLHAADDHWADNRIISGLGSGEALFDAVNEEDKRALVIEPEFARLLTVVNREGSTLSAVMREGWDSGNVATRTRQKKVQVQGAHISLIGHITREELLRKLTDTEKANGFVNRILFMCVKRSKMLPFGGGDVEVGDILHQLREAVRFSRTHANSKPIGFDSESAGLWEKIYPELSESKTGMLGVITSRADPHVLRLSLIYALLDCSPVLRINHLRAGLAIWKRADQSAQYLYTDSIGDPMADTILKALRIEGATGMTRWNMNNLFGGHKLAVELDRAIATLVERGSVRSAVEDTGGRRAIRYWAL